MPSPSPRDEEKGANSDAAELLHEWMPIALAVEYALDVLSESLPRINSLLDSGFGDISAGFASLAAKVSQQQEKLREMMVESHAFPLGSTRDEMTEEVAGLREIIKTQNPSAESLIPKMDALLARLDERQARLSAIGTASTQKGQEITGILSRLITSMQFQDRVSQHLVITSNVIGECTRRQADAFSHFRGEHSAASQAFSPDVDYARILADLLRLGELRHGFAERLETAGYGQIAEAIGLKGGINAHAPQKDEDDIELF